MANIVRTLTDDQLGTINKPWSKVVAQHYTLKALNIDPGVTPPENTLYVLDNVLYFNGNPITGGNITYTPKWRAYEIVTSEQQTGSCVVWVPALTVTIPESYPAQVRVSLNGVEVLPSTLQFDAGVYGDLFEDTPAGQDLQESGTKLTITIPQDNGTDFVFDADSSILIWNLE
jgi:hypothetical protein